MEDKFCIKLKCIECEYCECPITPQGSLLWLESKKGCVREVSEDDFARYYYYMEEVGPFMYKDTTKEYQRKMYKEIIDFLYHIYEDCPVKETIGHYGKSTSYEFPTQLPRSS